jgi:tetratricopeptide (TPR) repeat protein
MAADRISSVLFVGRKDERDQFKRFLMLESPVNILSIHTNGEGGIGKTQLVLRMKEDCQTLPNVIFAKDLIDFYHTESRFRHGVMRQIATNLNAVNFPEFSELIQKFQATEDIGERQELFPRVEEAFRKDYASFAAKRKDEKEIVVLFFDTYEAIQGSEITVNGQKQAETTGFSRWIETQLFPHILENTRIVVSGRYPLQEVDRSRLLEINLCHFFLADTKNFWKACFGVETESDLATKIGSEVLIETFHTLADGRPVLLALFADWINYERNPLSPEDLLHEIEQRVGKITQYITKDQKQLFEKALIERIASLIAPEDRAVTYMAVAYRRMTPELFHFLTDVPLEICQNILLERLKPLSFIKYKERDIILLHDEMQRLVLEHWWNEQDANRDIRRSIAKDLVQYYDKTLLAVKDILEEAQETYSSELLEYALLADPKGDGLNRFRNEFDVALEDGRYDYADLLLREAEHYYRQHPGDIPFPDFLRIDSRRIGFRIEAERKYEEALQTADKILEQYRGKPEWENSNVRGRILFRKGTVEYFLGKFEEAVNSFREAKQVFYDFGDDIRIYEMNNWIGLAFYARGNFVQARRWWTQGREGFAELLGRKFDEREHRRLLQDIRYSFSNLAFIDSHTGHFQSSMRHAEIALNIGRHLPRNDRETARMRILASEMFVFAGRAIDARHHAHVAEKLIEEGPIHDPTWEARLKTNLCLSQYRKNQLAYLLEYYRAEEIEKIVQGMGFIQYAEIEEAEKLVKEAIDILTEGSFKLTEQSLKDLKRKDIPDEILKDLSSMKEQEFARKNEFLAAVQRQIGEKQTDRHKECILRYTLERPDNPRHLANTYYALGELAMVTPSKEHWHESEDAFLQALKWGEMSQFNYRVVDTLESIVTLYYFWNGTLGTAEEFKELKEHNQRQMTTYQEKLDDYDDMIYPELFGKYKVTRGDNEFDEGLRLLRTENEKSRKTIMNVFKGSFAYYVRAAELMQEFNVDRYYLTLRVFYNRLNTLINALQEKNISLDWMDDLQSAWKGKAGEFNEIYKHVQLRVKPEEQRQDIENLEYNLHDILKKGDFGIAALLNECLIGAYRPLIASDEKNNEDRAHLIHRLNAQASLYRTLGDEYQAEQCITDARKILKPLEDSPLKQGLEGCIDASEGALKYRKGEYGRLLELFLQGELGLACRRFDRQFPGQREEALRLLQQGEKKIEEAKLEELRQSLSEARFRIGELLMLDERFEKALDYLEKAITDTEKSEDTYRCDNAMESYVNALYFSGKYDYKKPHEYEKQLEQKLGSPGEPIYPSLMSRLRIVQGDARFSSLFERRDEPTGEYTYILRKSPIDIYTLRRMLRYYVEACNFMAQHSTTNFAAAVRFLQRRIELISDKEALQIIQSGLRDVWIDQEYLREKTEELDTLVQFAKIRSMMLEDETTK